jgi:hypothetical protein
MSSLGVHFALSTAQERQLLAAGDDNEVMQLVEDIEEADETPHVDTDKAWDALHRCLSDGTLDLDAGEYPLSHAVLGGQQMLDGDDYSVIYVTAEQVHDVATALQAVTQDWLRDRYAELDEADYGPRSDEDFDYTWENFGDVAGFFAESADQDRAVIFTVDN